jgi:hypothetical protein
MAAIKDVCTQVDLIAALHLECLFNLSPLGSARDQSNGTTRIKTGIPHSKSYDAVQLRHRLEFTRGLAVRAQGLNIKIDMAKAASSQREAST